MPQHSISVTWTKCSKRALGEIRTSLRSLACPLGTNPPWACFFLWLSANLHSNGWEGAGGQKEKKSTLLTHILLLLTQHLIVTSFVTIRLKREEKKGPTLTPPPTLPAPPQSPTQSSGSHLDKLPVEVGDDSVALLRGVHPSSGEDQRTVTHH